MSKIQGYFKSKVYDKEVDLPIYRDITEYMRQEEKSIARKDQHRFIKPRILYWAYKNRYITNWDYSFYLSILSKGVNSVDELTYGQRFKFYEINGKVNSKL